MWRDYYEKRYVALFGHLYELSRTQFGKPADDPSLPISGIGRAEAMAYRDARGKAMRDPDWSEIECRLRRAYRSLKAAVAGG